MKATAEVHEHVAVPAVIEKWYRLDISEEQAKVLVFISDNTEPGVGGGQTASKALWNIGTALKVVGVDTGSRNYVLPVGGKQVKFAPHLSDGHFNLSFSEV